jgi:hypothetical protein
MAINVNTVYQTVLLILNKEQRGYITPNEFNKIATQVQLEIFEQYFEDLNQQLRNPGFQDEYADRVDNIEEKISIFKTYADASYYDEDPSGPLTNPYFYLPSDVHRIGTIMYKGEQACQQTNRGEYLHLYMSKLTRPTTNYPMYIQEGNVSPLDPITSTVLCDDCIRVYVYPEKINKDVSLSYVRKPKNVVWAYGIGSQGQYIWDGSPSGVPAPIYPASGSVDFEIDATEQTEVIIKILMYAGVVIRDPQIVQAAAQQAQATEINQKS